MFVIILVAFAILTIIRRFLVFFFMIWIIYAIDSYCLYLFSFYLCDAARFVILVGL